MSAFYQLEGFAQVERVVATRSVNVRWRGPVPSAVRETGDRVADSGVPVAYISVLYCEDDLIAAGRRILKEVSGGEGWVTGSVVPTPDYDGLVVEVEVHEGATMPAVTAFETAAGVPVTLQRGEVAEPALPPRG